MFSCFSIFLSTLLFLCCAHQVHVMCKHLISALCKHLISALLHYLYSLYLTFTALPSLSASLQTRMPDSVVSAANLMAFSLSHTSVPTTGTISLNTSGTLAATLFLQRQTLKMSLLEILQRSNTVLHTY